MFRLTVVLLLGILALLASAWIAGTLLVQPRNHPVAMPDGFSATSVSIAGSGRTIAGWWIDNGSASPVVLLLHGVRADRGSMVSRAQLLEKHGFSVLLIDLQGHGETPGEPITFGAHESADVTSALAWIRMKAAGRRVGVIGCSLGGASVLLAPQPSGSDDEHPTLAESEELFEAAASPKQLWVVHGARHQDLLEFDARGYEEHVLNFLMDNLRSRPSPAPNVRG